MNERPERVRAGFTLVELMMAAGILTLVVLMTTLVFIGASRGLHGGATHLSHIARGRAAEQRLLRHIQSASAVGVSTGGLSVMYADLTVGLLSFQDQDADPRTVENNLLVYDPDVSQAGDEEVICDAVSPIAGEALFSLVPSSPTSAQICFHVGEADPQGVRRTSNGYGVEVRMSATPRNAQYFVQ